MSGKYLAGGLVALALFAGALLYWLQVYAYYYPAQFAPDDEIMLGQAPLKVSDLRGIDANGLPLRFRACFKTDIPLETLAKTRQIYEKPTPLVGPKWFECFDAEEIEQALAAQQATAFLVQKDIWPKIDRVAAIFADGRGVIWHQLNEKEEPNARIIN